MGCIQSILTPQYDCGYRMGGIRAIYVVRRASIDDVAWEDTYTISIDAGSYVRIPCRGSFQSVEQVDEATGASYYLDTLSVTPLRQMADYSIPSLAELTYADPDDLVILVETWNVDYMFVLGYGFKDPAGSSVEQMQDFPVFRGGGQWVSGTEKTDANGATIIFTSAHPFPAAMATIADPSGVENPSTD